MIRDRRRNLKLLLLCAVCLLFGNMGTVVAQNARASLSGSVSDAQTKEVLQYVNVAVLSTKDSSMINGVITNENGRFSITNMKLGKFIVRIWAISNFLSQAKCWKVLRLWQKGR